MADPTNIQALRPGALAARRREPLFLYDSELRRVWVAGQRLHHGATGLALTWAGIAGLLGRGDSVRRLSVMLAGSALMAHDWHDRSVWLQPGPQPEQGEQPAATPRPRSFRLERRR